MEDSKILELLKKKSPQTTLEIAKSVDKSWHMVQEQLLEMQIDGKLDRITVGRQNLWFVKGQKMMRGTAANSMLLGIVALLAVLVIFNTLVITDKETASSGLLLTYDDALPGKMFYPAGEQIELKVKNKANLTAMLKGPKNTVALNTTNGNIVIGSREFTPGLYILNVTAGNVSQEAQLALGLVNINT
ncbi:MAG TPA: hypothetical protein VJI12_03500, partial [archaeon]|nr:hypothetical protein [archaeon]